MYYVSVASCLAVGITFIVSSISINVLRLFSRTTTHGLRADDWLSLAAMIFVLGECSIVIAGSRTDTIGSHSPNIGDAIWTFDDYHQALLKKFNVPFNMLSTFALASIKLSVLFFYRRIIVTKSFNTLCWILTAFISVWALVFFIEIASICRDDFDANFASLGVLKTKCGDDFAALISLVVLDFVVDLLLLILPMPFVWRLQMPLKRKIMVTITFCVGALAIACGATRMVIFIEILAPPVLSQTIVGGYHTDDQNGILSVLLFWGILEMGVGIFAICMPTLLPLGKQVSLKAIHRVFGTIFTMPTNVIGPRPPTVRTRMVHTRIRTANQLEDDEDEQIAIAPKPAQVKDEASAVKVMARSLPSEGSLETEVAV